MTRQNTKGEPANEWKAKADVPVRTQNIHNDTAIPHSLLVKGKATSELFQNVEFNLPQYIPASLDWVLQMKWQELQIKPLTSTSPISYSKES